jgi:pimeloyl-ACP methyl ester carboxylesterase
VAGPGADVSELELVVDGIRVFGRRVGGDGVPTVFAHGHPTDSRDWLPFMERLAGPSLAFDMPGWGRSERPGRDRLETSMAGLAGFFARCLEEAGVTEHKLVCHDWGSISLIAAQAAPERVRALVVINAVPLLPGYRWHWLARWFWRRRVLGELFNAAATKPAMRLLSRQASATPGPLPAEFIDAAWDARPAGAWPEALALYRSADPGSLAAAGACLGRLACPALVVWGSDPYIPLEFGRLYAERLPGAELLAVPGAGHWPWIDDPSVLDSVVGFLEP